MSQRGKSRRRCGPGKSRRRCGPGKSRRRCGRIPSPAVHEASQAMRVARAACDAQCCILQRATNDVASCSAQRTACDSVVRDGCPMARAARRTASVASIAEQPRAPQRATHSAGADLARAHVHPIHPRRLHAAGPSSGRRPGRPARRAASRRAFGDRRGGALVRVGLSNLLRATGARVGVAFIGRRRRRRRPVAPAKRRACRPHATRRAPM